MVIKAGILESEMIIITCKEKQNNKTSDEYLVDSQNIFAIHNLYTLFPHVKVIVELANASNVRFLRLSGFVRRLR